MSEDNAALTVTLKAGKGFDDPWIVVRGDNPEDVTAKLSGLTSVVQATIEAANLLHAANTAAPVLANAPAAAPDPAPQQQAAPGWATTPQQAAPAPQAPPQQAVVYHPEGKTCGACNSPVVFKSIFSRAKNKNFNLWSCPNQRQQGDGHFSEFQN